MNNIQTELNNLYAEYLEKIFSDRKLYEQILNFKVSSPLFIEYNVEFGKYADSDFKVLYVGKETNYWYNQNERKNDNLLHDLQDTKKYLNGLTDLYKKFNLGHNYNTPIFIFMDIIINKLRVNNKSTGILWTNILRHDGFNGKVSVETEKKISYNNNYIFRRELEILKPDAVVFVTGPNYDYILENSFSGLEKIKIGKKSEREICLLKHDNLPDKTIRIYHPGYHNRISAEYKLNLGDIINDLMKNK